MSSRPLKGEPSSLDLVNTEWIENGQRQDFLENVQGTASWIREVGLRQPDAPIREIQRSLIKARAAIRGVLEHPGNLKAIHELNSILEKGSVFDRLAVDGPKEFPQVSEKWYAAWISARNLLHLLKAHPGRIRRCAHPDCVLYFLDSTKNRTRRWCKMENCGNRAKARRHYLRITKSRRS